MSISELNQREIEFVTGGEGGVIKLTNGAVIKYESVTCNPDGSVTFNLVGGGTFTPAFFDPVVAQAICT